MVTLEGKVLQVLQENLAHLDMMANPEELVLKVL